MKKCKECGREEIGYGSLLDENGYCFSCGVKHNKEKIKRLQEQLNEANDTLIKSQNMEQPDRSNFVAQYLLKWGVK